MAELEWQSLIDKQLSKGKYKLSSFTRETEKSWTFDAVEEQGLGNARTVTIKLLKKGLDIERVNQFLQEATRLKQANHPGIPEYYESGFDDELQMHYIVMKHIKGITLEEELKRGVVPSIQRSVRIARDIADTVMELQPYGGHHDIKPANIMLPHDEEKTGVLDLGSTINELEGSGDILSIGRLLETLIGERKIPKSLEKIIKKSQTPGEFDSPEELRDELDSYLSQKQKSLSRRKFLIKGAVAIGAAAIGGGMIYNELLNQKKSINEAALTPEQTPPPKLDPLDEILREIEESHSTDKKSFYQLLVELGKRISRHPLRRMYEELLKGPDHFFFATTSLGHMFPTSSKYTISGMSVSLMKSAYALTGDGWFDDVAKKLAAEIEYDPEKETDFNPIRFLHAEKQITEAASYFDKFYDEKLGIYDLSNTFSRFFDSPNSSENQSKKILEIGSLSGIFPLILEASKLENPSKSQEYKKRLVNQTKAIEKYLIRPDGSTRDLARFDPETGEIEEAARYSFAPQGCFSRGHAGTINWFVSLFEETNYKHYLEMAKYLQEYYGQKLPDDSVPYADLSKEYLSREDPLLRDTSAATRNTRTLAHLNYNLKVPMKEEDLTKQLRALTAYISRDENSNVVISGGCASLKNEEYTNSCLIWALDDFLKTIKTIKEKAC